MYDRALDTLTTILVAHSIYTYMVLDLNNLEGDLAIPWYVSMRIYPLTPHTSLSSPLPPLPSISFHFEGVSHAHA